MLDFTVERYVANNRKTFLTRLHAGEKIVIGTTVGNETFIGMCNQYQEYAWASRRFQELGIDYASSVATKNILAEIYDVSGEPCAPRQLFEAIADLPSLVLTQGQIISCLKRNSNKLDLGGGSNLFVCREEGFGHRNPYAVVFTVNDEVDYPLRPYDLRRTKAWNPENGIRIIVPVARDALF